MLDKLPKNFFYVFANKMCKRYGKSYMTIQEKFNVFRNFGTNSWYDDLEQTCLECNCFWFYNYYNMLSWEESDKVGYRISEIMINKELYNVEDEKRNF